MHWVVFDIGGVMVRIRNTWGEAADAAKVEIARAARSMKQAEFSLVDRYQAGAIDTADYVLSLSEFLEIERSEEAIAVHNAFLAEPFQGVQEIVDELVAAGIGTACLSNTNELHWRVLRGSGAYLSIDKLSVPVASQIIKLAKPDPEIYRAMERIIDADPSEILYFDDHPDYVESANSLDWIAQRIDPLAVPALQIRKTLVEHGVLTS